MLSVQSPRTRSKQFADEVKLRPWQKEAFGVYLDAVSKGDTSILWEATPGAGKTTAALVVSLHQVRRLQAPSVVVVVPTAHLKGQWARAAANLGLHLDSNFSNSKRVLSKDFQGCVVTYQQVAQSPSVFKRLTSRGCVVLDEVHHAADGLAWGDGLRIAFFESQFILCLSGTPFRSDNNPIPFVPYDEHGFSMPHYSYSYSRAVEDGVCRPTAFFTYGGEVSWREDIGDVAARFSDPLDHIASSRRLRAALDPASGWLNPMIRDANTLLTNLRKEHPDAGALLVAPDQISARKIAQLIQQLTGMAPVVILSDDSEASRRLKNFRDSNLPWLVACNMVSEGVDIPRLRIGIYATTIRTKMYFRQFLGRVVRRVANLSCLQVAYCYLPADPILTKLAEEIEEEIRHCINPKNSDVTLEERERSAKRDDAPPSMFEPLRAVSTGLDTVIVHGNQLSLFQSSMAGQEMMQVVHTKVAERLDERRSKAEEKAFLALEIRRLVSMYHKRSGKTHAQIHSQLNGAQGIKSQAFCTEQQLRERLSLLRKMVNGK